LLKWDGHTHTKYCCHGSDAGQENYLDRAIELGFQRYTLSEHPPLPAAWVADARLMRELAMPEEELPHYFNYALRMKRKYEGRIEVTVGLELDYLHGANEFSERMVERWGGVLEDAVVSVHFLPGTGGMRCIDYTPDDFREGLLAYYGSMSQVVDEYYNHVEAAIEWAARLPVRCRLGHINLIEKFRLALPEMDDEQIERRLRAILPKLAAAGVGIDVNTAGLRVATCGRPYVPEWFLRECRERGILCVYGSDAHRPEHVGAGWEWYEEMMAGEPSRGEDGNA
jgi:histidinol-phosphatase (PHP family)